MRIVAGALESAPGMVVSGLVWRHGVGEIDPGAGARQAAATGAGTPTAAATRRQSGIVAGEIKPFYGDYRGAVAAINAFADRLRRDPAVAEARIVKLPLNIDPALPLAGNTIDGRDRSGVADFKVLMVLRPDT